MNIAVRYFTKSGNTKMLADALASAVCVKAEDVSVGLSGKTDILFLGSSVYAGKCAPEIIAFLESNKANIGTIVCFGSSASGKSTAGQIGTWAKNNGIEVSEQVFSCPGHFLLAHKNRPNSSDIENIKAFAKEVTGSLNA